MIRIVVLGVACLAGLGAIAAAAKKSAPPPAPEMIMPVVAGNKTDRLPFTIKLDMPTAAERADVAYVQPGEEEQADLPPSAPKQVALPPRRDFTPRHWHDPHDLNAKAANKRADTAKGPRKGAADQPLKQVEGKRCRPDGLDPLLRKLNLSPPCDS
ncbi:hypothetical protein ACVWXO_001911 [Bradyrhizobium sp. LM2.7]